MEEQFDIRDYRPSGKERDFENALRPLQFGDFSGQDKVVDNLRIFVKAARLRAEALDHVLLHGPPGLGKTTLSNIIANELVEESAWPKASGFWRKVRPKT